MYNIKTLLAAATMAVAMAAGASSASAAPWDRHMDRQMDRRMDNHMTMHRPYVMHERAIQVLRDHRYRLVADPIFIRGHYVVKTFNRRGRTVFVEINPYTGAFLGEFRA
jgi:Ni/Co efflux regulator RcnB